VPPMPSWTGMHPLVVHFPIALLAVVPLLVLVGGISAPRRGVLASALLLLVLGTAGAWLAVATGESAGKVAERLPDVDRVLERHEALAETTRTIFTVLTLAFVALLAVPAVLRREPRRAVRLGAMGAFLVAYTGALLCLASTAHQGGTLVHGKGIHAALASKEVP
jgi:uncharacterized membrane protein